MTGLLLALHAGVLWWFGQPAVCACGHVTLWVGDVWSSEMSQQLADWYTFSHIIHGFLFYLAAWLLFPRMPVRYRLMLALGTEVGWEILENTPWLIERYRQQALAVGYVGDSILNSLSDSCAMMIGFVLARRLPVHITVALALAMEAFTGYMIHDNLTLNILNFIHQFDAVTRWQASA